MGVRGDDIPGVADLLGTKLTPNEFVAYLELTTLTRPAQPARTRSPPTPDGFANFASMGIQLGGIGAMAPEAPPRPRPPGRPALFVGFLATLVNAAIAGVLDLNSEVHHGTPDRQPPARRVA